MDTLLRRLPVSASAATPLDMTFISSVADRDDYDVIHVFYQDNKGYLVHEKHNDKNPNKPPTDEQRALRLYSPLGSVFTLAQSSSTSPGLHVYAASDDLIGTMGTSFEILQLIPDDKPVAQAAAVSKLGAMYDGNSIFVCYQKAGAEWTNTIFEKKLVDNSEWAVCNNACAGANLSVYEPAIHESQGPSGAPPKIGFAKSLRRRSPRAMAYKLKARLSELDADTEVDGTCRYMVYNGTDHGLWWVWIDAPGGPDIEKVQNIKPQDIKPNTPVAVICVLDLFAIYYINDKDNICRIFRGDYGWGVPKLVEGVKPRKGTNLAVSRDLSQGERVVWLSYQGEDGAITGKHDFINELGRGSGGGNGDGWNGTIWSSGGLNEVDISIQLRFR